MPGRQRKNATTYLRGSNPRGMFVGRKPQKISNEGVTANDSETNILMSIDSGQDKVAMKTTKYRDQYMPTLATSMRLLEP